VIIHRIRATNVLKYAKLSIDLAERGLIGISGANESGKSTIGETVCFALFGRTFSIAPEELDRIVRWGEEECSVLLDFSVGERRYLLSRTLDRDGKHSAKLSRPGNEQKPIARGVQQVGERLLAILGFAYDEFVESFYLAQREITTPHPHSHAVKLMAGVAPLESVSRALDAEIVERREVIEEISTEWEAVDLDIKALGIEQGHLRRLEESQQGKKEQAALVGRMIDGIERARYLHAENTRKIHELGSASRRIGLFRVLSIVLAVVFFGSWLLFAFAAETTVADSLEWLLTSLFPQWQQSDAALLGYTGVGFGALFVVLLIFTGMMQRRAARLRDQMHQLTEALGQAQQIEIDSIDEPGAGDGQGSDEPAHLEPGRPGHQEYAMLRKLILQGEATTALVSEFCGREVGWLGRVEAGLKEQIQAQDEAIQDEQGRLKEAANFAEVLRALSAKREELTERIADRRRGIELLDGAMAELSSRFNRDVKVLVGRLLPLFTDGRYEHLQIDEDLKVRVFSSDKRDFMDLEEVSSGTQRQIMLALRLALSKKLLDRTVKGRQFAFLDEPFAFFDEGRTRTALRALADLGGDISQVWIVAQDFPENCEVAFDTIITCERESRTLSVTT
jgi:exonuclease SbcC